MLHTCYLETIRRHLVASLHSRLDRQIARIRAESQLVSCQPWSICRRLKKWARNIQRAQMHCYTPSQTYHSVLCQTSCTGWGVLTGLSSDR